MPEANFGVIGSLRFETIQLGVPMTSAIYKDARSSGSQTPGHPAFDFSASTPCNSLVSRFQIHTYTRDTQTSTLEVLASFEQLCDGTSFGEGCLRYKP